MAATHGARRNGAIDPHYSSEQFTNSSVMNPLPVEKFLDWLDGSIFWRYLVLLKIASLTGGIYLRSNFIYLSVRYFPWPSFIARYQPEWFLLLPNITFHFILVCPYSVERRHCAVVAMDLMLMISMLELWTGSIF